MKRFFYGLVILAALALASGEASGAEPSSGSGPVWIIELADTINPGTSDYLMRGLRLAQQDDACLVVIRLDTPGGLAQSMRQMAQAIMSSTVPVAVFVAPPGARATSAGAFLVLAGSVAAMAPATHLGAASPVGSGGKDIEGTMGKKAVSDLSALIKSLARRRGIDPKFAEEMVTEAKSYDATQAKELKIIDYIARDIGTLLKKLEGREVLTGAGKMRISTKGKVLHFHKPGARESLLSILANPNLVYILMMIGLMGLYFEFSHPGTIFPGVVGGISLILALFGMSTLPVNLTGLALIGLSIVLFIAEIKVISNGLLSLGGAVSLILGSIMLFESEDQMVRVSLTVLVPTVTGVVAFFLGVTFLAVRAQVGKSPTGQEGLVGETAVVMDPERVKIMGEIWKAVSATTLAAGQKVVVKKVKGLLLEVEPLGDSAKKGSGDTN